MSDANPAIDATIPRDPDALRDLVKRAQEGDESTLPVMQEMLKKPIFLDTCGNLAKHTQIALLEKHAGQNVLVKEGLRQKVASLQTELAGPNPSPLERLLAERIATCWLHLHHLEYLYSKKDDMSLELGNYHQKNIDRAHRRYLSAIKTLAVVRKLAVPVLQVNIARRQVNVAGPCVPTEGTKGAV